MPPRLRHSALLVASLACLVLLGGCGKKNPPAKVAPTPAASRSVPTVAVAPAPAASTKNTAVPMSAGTAKAPMPPAPVTGLNVAKVTLGSEVNAEHQVDKPANSFTSTDKTIYASVATVGSSGGATLNARWTYLEGTSQLVSSISQSIATDGPATTTFKVQNPDLWPAGKYRIEISLDGKSVATQDFDITKR